jgi:RNase adaptor protein for sRNA GlmZ degradation
MTALARLAEELRATGLSSRRSGELTPSWVDRATSAISALGSARRAAAATSPEREVLVAAGGGRAAAEVLATPDGRALVRAHSLAPAEARAAVGAHSALEEATERALAAELEKAGLGEDGILAVRRGLQALRNAGRATAQTPAELLLTTAGTHDEIRAMVNGITSTQPPAPVLRAATAEPALVRSVIRAEGSQQLTQATSELMRRLSDAGMSGPDQERVGRDLHRLNEARLKHTRGLAQEMVRIETRRSLLDVGSLRADADVVVRRFRSPRRERAQQWLDRIDANEAQMLAEAADQSALVLDRVAHGGATMVRQLWTMFRAGRVRAPKIDFPEYVKVLERLHRGLHGEYQFAFWAGERYILLKAPDALVTQAGTDAIVIARGGGKVYWVDQKALAANDVAAVSALTRNLPKNLADDLAEFERLVERAAGLLPPELAMAIPRTREALFAVRQLVHRLTKDEIEMPLVQAQITAILKRFDIERVVANAGGSVEGLGRELSEIDFGFWNVQGD